MQIIFERCVLVANQRDVYSQNRVQTANENATSDIYHWSCERPKQSRILTADGRSKRALRAMRDVR